LSDLALEQRIVEPRVTGGNVTVRRAVCAREAEPERLELFDKVAEGPELYEEDAPSK
jgi:hypothetical protein